MRRTAAAFLFVASAAASASAADWPMWRCDAGRTASSDQELAETLHLQWVRKLPQLEPAWTGVRDLSWTKEAVGLQEDRSTGFEVIYSPVVIGRMLVVGSSHNDSVTGIDVATGEEKWRFYTEGPVRLAPAGWRDRVYVASDDGCLYCLSAADGTQLWKFRGAPMNRRVVGDERIVSAWPARGGPVVADGQVYFAAGIYPFMGIHVYALDADTGKMIWASKDRGSTWTYGGEKTAPQGPLAVVGDMLLIPNNRTSVTCLDRKTGAFLYHPPISSHWRVAGAGKQFFLEGRFGGRGGTLHDVDTGAQVANVPGMPVFANGAMYWADPFKTKSVHGGNPPSGDPAAGKAKTPPASEPAWSLRPSGQAASSMEVKLRAGGRLYVACGSRAVAVDIPAAGNQASESWSAEVEGTIGETLAAADRLFVVTREGSICCFGAEKAAAKTHTVQPKELPAASDAWTKQAADILKATGVRSGYAIVLGVGSGRLAEELLKQSDLNVAVVDPDAAKIDGLRRRLDAAGLYGKRAQCITAKLSECGLPPYLASLVLSENPQGCGVGRDADLAKAMLPCLRPYGGALCVPADGAALAAWAKTDVIRNAEVVPAGAFALLRRTGALPGSASWTHQHADAGNTVCSRDDLVRAPLGLLWFGGPSTPLMFDRHYCGPRPQVAGGRMFVLGPGGLTAIDVYTGRLLWQIDLPELAALGKPYLPSGGYNWDLIGASVLGSPYVSLDDGIYVASGKICLRLDPATGEKRSEIQLDPAAGSVFGPIRIWEDVLLAAVDPVGIDKTAAATNEKNGKALTRKDGWTGAASKRIAAFDRNTGKMLWSLAAQQAFGHNAVVAGDGRVFCLDRWPAAPDAEAAGGSVLALDARTGKQLWSTSESVFGSWLCYSAETGTLLQGGFGGRTARDSRAVAWNAEDGKLLWDAKAGIGPWLLNGTMLISQGRQAVDIRTGKPGRKFDRLDGKSCDYDIGGTHVITDRAASATYLDVDTGRNYRLGGVRSGCVNTLIPADGVLVCPYAGTGCVCALNIRASMALVHMPELVVPEAADDKPQKP